MHEACFYFLELHSALCVVAGLAYAHMKFHYISRVLHSLRYKYLRTLCQLLL